MELLVRLDRRVPTPSVEPRGGGEVVEAGAEHQHCSDADDTERRADQCRPDRHRGRAPPGFERHAQAGGQRGRRAGAIAAGLLTDGREPGAPGAPAERATRQCGERAHEERERDDHDDAEAEHERVEVEAGMHLGLARDAEGHERRREERDRDREHRPAQRRLGAATAVAASARRRPVRPIAASVSWSGSAA